jgi:hypothetical protein
MGAHDVRTYARAENLQISSTSRRFAYIESLAGSLTERKKGQPFRSDNRAQAQSRL